MTDGLAKKYPYRVADFPPDETTLVGAGMGYSQVGFVPIVEIPYAKYLDCASDMYYEAIITHWLTNGKQKDGLLIRLQGFDKGVFGGNYHTHNTLYIPPGLDVVCYSNGYDYVRGMRYAVTQARGGRVVMSVDSTDLLNRRHVDMQARDDAMLSHYPEDPQDIMTFDDIVVYSAAGERVTDQTKPRAAVITYGNGVPTALLAAKTLVQSHGWTADAVIVIDCPCLSQLPSQLESLLLQCGSTLESLVFADVCKAGSNMPLNYHLHALQEKKLLPRQWKMVGACPTYNPLSRTLTFLSEEDIVSAVLALST